MNLENFSTLNFWGSIWFGIKGMDKVCEYCKVLRPVVYCKADSANLCLPCDVKIHSANALSNRHSRTLVCDLCRCHWAYIKCSNHQMFMCRSCDRRQHNVLSQHQRRVISSYMGCPSAKDLAELWGFDLNGLDDSTRQDQSFSTSGVSVNTGAVNCNRLTQSCPQAGGSSIVFEVDCVTSQYGAEYEMGSKSKYTKVGQKVLTWRITILHMSCMYLLMHPVCILAFFNLITIFHLIYRKEGRTLCNFIGNMICITAAS